jgi:FkbM family methyltransferase
VVIFEPNPHNLSRLRRNLELNDISPRVVAIALADTSGRIPFDHPTLDQREWKAKGSIAPAPQTDSVDVDARAGDELVDAGEIPAPTVVKIDVEGAESLVIDGLQDTLARDKCRLLYCEIHQQSDQRRSTKTYGATPEATVGAIEALGFATEQIAERPAEVLLKGTKQ